MSHLDWVVVLDEGQADHRQAVGCAEPLAVPALVEALQAEEADEVEDDREGRYHDENEQPEQLGEILPTI